MKRMIAVVLLSLLFPAVVTAQSYYVDATLGNDARDGQSEANASLCPPFPSSLTFAE